MKNPAAYIFELASYKNKSNDEYSGWKEYIQVSMPHVPEKAIRNLRPLYAGEPINYKEINSTIVVIDAALKLRTE